MKKRAVFVLLVAGTVLLAGVLSSGRAGWAGPPPPDPSGEQPEKTSVEASASPLDMLSSEKQLSSPTNPEADRYQPAIAYNWKHREYLVVWHNTWPDGHRDIYARRVSEAGKLLTQFAITAGPNDRFQPDVVYNATDDEYLVVWMYNPSGDNQTYNIWGRTVSWNGGVMGPEKEIISYTNRTFWTPRAAWNSIRNEYMVVWAAYKISPFEPVDVSHAILDSAGNKVYGAIISTAYQPHQPDITYNLAADEYLVVWRRMWGPADGDIMAARLGGYSGSVITPPGVFAVSDPVEDQSLPAVTTNEQHRYLVVWQHVFDPSNCCDWDIRGQELNVQGGLEGGELSIAASTDDETAPDVAARPGTHREYLIVWQRTATTGEVVRAGVWGDAGWEFYGDISAVAFWNSESPVVAAGKPSFFVAYEGDAQGDPTVFRHIYGRRWVPDGTFLPLTVRKW